MAFYNPRLPMHFWSRRWMVEPQGPGTFELPFGVRYSEYARVAIAYRLFLVTFPRHLEQPTSPRLIRTPSCFVLGSCTVLVHMAKDYGDNVIFWDERPFGEIPVHWSHSPAETFVSWSPILSAIDLMLQDVQSRKNPIWDHVLDVGILFVPSSSAISRQWSVGMRSSRGNVSEE